MNSFFRATAFVILAMFLPGAPAAAQSASPAAGGVALPAFDGPPAPVAPEVITRNADGRATIRAVRVREPMRIDGALDEAHYRDVPAMSDFIQIEPTNGAPATEKTEVWLAFDEDNVYVTFRAWDTQIDRLVANEMRRDNNNVFSGSDLVTFVFDPLFDRRNSVVFSINPVGGRQDGQVTSERQYAGDWNPVWSFKTGRFDGGWTMEAAVPFKSIKYRSGLWGFNAMRVKRSKNEVSFLTRMPNSRGQQAIQQISLGAVVVGMEVPSGSRLMDIKPYATSSLTTNRTSTPRVSNDPSGDVGLDAKIGLTDNLSADLTVNTDFAQVEADDQQINLTRFSLFFPEKREFFLENAGVFSFGGVSGTGFMAGGSDAPILFYSRRIGLNRGRPVPIDVGGRMTGRVGRFSIGAVNIQSGDESATSTPSTNFSVLRLRRDFLRASNIGVIATNRSHTQNGTGGNAVFGADATFSFFENVLFNTYWARTQTDGLHGDDTSYRAQFDYPADRYGVQLEHLVIGDNFNPEVGFVRRDDMVREWAQLRFSPRPRTRSAIRRYFYQASIEHIADGDGRMESRERLGEFALEFQNADRFSVVYTNLYEFLPAPFAISPGVRLPVGGYDFDNVRVAFNMGQQHRFGFNTSVDYGTFYNGHKATMSVSRGRMGLTSQLSVEPTYTFNSVDLVQGSFTTHLSGTRVTYTMSPMMFTSALMQYSSASNSVNANVRLRWEYRPGSELFIVYNEERNTLTPGIPNLSGRALIVKVNRLFRL